MDTTEWRNSPPRALMRLTTPFSVPPTPREWSTWTMWITGASPVQPYARPLLQAERGPEDVGALAPAGPVLLEQAGPRDRVEQAPPSGATVEQHFARMVSQLAAGPAGAGEPAAH